MFDPKPRVHSPPIKGNLYSFTVGGGLIEHDNPGLLHNGFAWNPNGSEFLLAHSREGRIDACEFNIEQGELGAIRIFAEVPKDLGVSDGGAFDEEGFTGVPSIGGCLHRYAPDGRLDRIVNFRSTHMMAFCGPDLCDSTLRAQRTASAATPTRAVFFGCAWTCRVLLVFLEGRDI